MFFLRCNAAMLQFPRDDAERIRSHPRVKRGLSLQFRHRTFFDEFAHGLHEFEHRRLVHHGFSSSRIRRLTRSISVSDARRPMAARSTEPSARKPWYIVMHMIPHLSEPNTIHGFTSSGVKCAPPAVSYPCSRSFKSPNPPTSFSLAPKRQELTQIQPMSSTGSPICVSSQSSTASMPLGEISRLPLRKSPCTSAARLHSFRRGSSH